MWGSGFIPITIYANFVGGGSAPPVSNNISTESGIDISTESGTDISTES